MRTNDQRELLESLLLKSTAQQMLHLVIETQIPFQTKNNYILETFKPQQQL